MTIKMTSGLCKSEQKNKKNRKNLPMRLDVVLELCPAARGKRVETGAG